MNLVVYSPFSVFQSILYTYVTIDFIQQVEMVLQYFILYTILK